MTYYEKVLLSLQWIVEFMDEHPEWTQEYFTKNGNCGPETQWLMRLVRLLMRGNPLT